MPGSFHVRGVLIVSVDVDFEEGVRREWWRADLGQEVQVSVKDALSECQGCVT